MERCSFPDSRRAGVAASSGNGNVNQIVNTPARVPGGSPAAQAVFGSGGRGLAGQVFSPSGSGASPAVGVGAGRPPQESFYHSAGKNLSLNIRKVESNFENADTITKKSPQAAVSLQCAEAGEKDNPRALGLGIGPKL